MYLVGFLSRISLLPHLCSEAMRVSLKLPKFRVQRLSLQESLMTLLRKKFISKGKVLFLGHLYKCISVRKILFNNQIYKKKCIREGKILFLGYFALLDKDREIEKSACEAECPGKLPVVSKSRGVVVNCNVQHGRNTA